MKTKSILNIIAAVALALFAIPLLTGCTVVKEHVKLDAHKPSASTARVEGASATRVKVEVPPITESAIQMFGTGIVLEQKTILEGTTISQALQQAFESELAARGFVQASGGGAVRFEVGTVSFTQAPPLMFRSRKTVASLAGTLEVRKPDGTKTYTKEIQAGCVTNVFDLRAKKGFALAFGGAVDDVVTKAFSNPEFLNAILTFSKP